MSLQKNITGKSNKIRQSAKGRDCTVRLPGICNFNSETTVLAHLNGGGAGMKSNDWESCYCCSSCHDEIDRRTRLLDFDQVLIFHLKGCIETRQILFNEGYLKVA